MKTISGLWSFKAIFANQKHFDHLKLYEITELPDNVFLVLGCFFVNQIMMTPRTNPSDGRNILNSQFTANLAFHTADVKTIALEADALNCTLI